MLKTSTETRTFHHSFLDWSVKNKLTGMKLRKVWCIYSSCSGIVLSHYERNEYNNVVISATDPLKPLHILGVTNGHSTSKSDYRV